MPHWKSTQYFLVSGIIIIIIIIVSHSYVVIVNFAKTMEQTTRQFKIIHNSFQIYIEPPLLNASFLSLLFVVVFCFVVVVVVFICLFFVFLFGLKFLCFQRPTYLVQMTCSKLSPLLSKFHFFCV